jgi:hypothetical protein
LQDGVSGLQLPKRLTSSPDFTVEIGRGEIPVSAALVFVVRTEKSIAKSPFVIYPYFGEKTEVLRPFHLRFLNATLLFAKESHPLVHHESNKDLTTFSEVK